MISANCLWLSDHINVKEQHGMIMHETRVDLLGNPSKVRKNV
jgi:hypothetical protein